MCKFDNITVLEGEEGTDKSTAIRVLAGDQFFSDQTILGIRDKEIQEQLTGVWAHEIADLSGMRRADVEQVKAFASRQVDRARPAYGRTLEHRPRRSIDWATTNDDIYLQSQTGNRRFWPLPCGVIDIEALRQDRLLLLGEAAHYESKGESIILDEALWPDATVEQEKRRVKHPWEDVLADIPNIADLGDEYKQIVYTIDYEYLPPCPGQDAIAGTISQELVTSVDLLTHVLRIMSSTETTMGAHEDRRCAIECTIL
jgi:predicted P-loop ATPase